MFVVLFLSLVLAETTLNSFSMLGLADADSFCVVGATRSSCSLTSQTGSRVSLCCYFHSAELPDLSCFKVAYVMDN